MKNIFGFVSSKNVVIDFTGERRTFVNTNQVKWDGSSKAERSIVDRENAGSSPVRPATPTPDSCMVCGSGKLTFTKKIKIISVQAEKIQTQQKEVELLEARVKFRETRIVEKNLEIQSLSDSISFLRAQINEFEQQNESLKTSVLELQGKLRKVDADIQCASEPTKRRISLS
jgi:cell division protein FtsL